MATRSEPYVFLHIVQQALASDVLPTNSSRSDMHQPLPDAQSFVPLVSHEAREPQSLQSVPHAQME